MRQALMEVCMFRKHRSRTCTAASPVLAPHVTLAALVAAAASPLLVSAIAVPPPLVLPVVAAASLGAAALAALWAWRSASKGSRDHVTLWDISGACALIGFAAGMLSDPERVMESWPTHDSP
jgi:hypothetical protein